MKGRRGNREALGWGLILMAAGVCVLLANNGVMPESVHNWWPFVVVVAGLGSLAGARDPKGVGSAVTTMGLGVWTLIAANDWYELGWGRSWPLALVAIGLGSVTEAAVGMIWRKADEEGGHVA